MNTLIRKQFVFIRGDPPDISGGTPFWNHGKMKQRPLYTGKRYIPRPDQVDKAGNQHGHFPGKDGDYCATLPQKTQALFD